MDIITNHLETIPGIALYPIISFIIFLAVFIVMVVHTLTIDKTTINEMENIPLDENDQDNP